NRTSFLKCSSARGTEPFASLLIKGDILASRRLPRQIGGHAALDDRLPSPSGLMEPDCTLHGIEQSRPGVLTAHEAAAFRSVLGHVDHVVREAARGPDDPDRPIPKATHLSQPARLALQVHEE